MSRPTAAQQISVACLQHPGPAWDTDPGPLPASDVWQRVPMPPLPRFPRPVVLRIGEGERWCTRCGETVGASSDHCTRCGSRGARLVDPAGPARNGRPILRPEEYTYAS